MVQHHGRTVGYALLPIMLLASLLSAACQPRPAVPQPKSPTKPEWKLVDGILPQGHDPEVPLLLIREDSITIHLPHFRRFTVTGLEVVDEVVTVQTDLRIPKQSMPGVFGLVGGLESSCGRPVVLEVTGLQATGANNIQVLSLDGWIVAPILGVADAIRCVEDEVTTDFDGSHTIQHFVVFDHTASRLLYGLSYVYLETIDRAGSKAVSGRFSVDSVTGEISINQLTVIPLESTRQLADGCRLLDWTQDRQLLTIVGSELVTYGVDGTVVGRVGTNIDISCWEFVTLDGNNAWFTDRDGECVGISAGTGKRVEGHCPEPSARTGELTPQRSLDGSLLTTKLTVRIGDADVTATIIARDEKVLCDDFYPPLKVAVTRGGETAEVDTSAAKDRVVMEHWAADTTNGLLYLSTGMYGSPLFSRATSYSLWCLDPQTNDLRHVTLMPGPSFRLSPCGSWAVYECDGPRVLIVDLRRH